MLSRHTWVCGGRFRFIYGSGSNPKRAINLPPAFLTPSSQEYHFSNCLTSKNHTNLRIVPQV
ncbi:hypothetical protein B9T54_17980 [Leptospira borgpetersenii serovar Hardjo-bovis]|nr:hypothetical protein B9T54_17980 [Leptospira borgpetersenii serovar Hardjo-bovis]